MIFKLYLLILIHNCNKTNGNITIKSGRLEFTELTNSIVFSLSTLLNDKKYTFNKDYKCDMDIKMQNELADGNVFEAKCFSLIECNLFLKKYFSNV